MKFDSFVFYLNNFMSRVLKIEECCENPMIDVRLTGKRQENKYLLFIFTFLIGSM